MRHSLFFAIMVLTFIGSMGKIRENGWLGNQDKKCNSWFLLLTQDVKPGKLGELDKCDIVESPGDKSVGMSIISRLVSGG
jgi:hypothetical protein